MTQLLHLATPADLDRLLPMVAAFHDLQGFGTDAAHQRAAIEPLLGEVPHGAVWLIGPRKAPVGYIVVTFGWSVEFGGLDAIVDELYIRERVRGRGMGSEALNAIAKVLREAGVRALHLEVDLDNERARRFYQRARFQARDGYALLSRRL